jgi:hypothetical protein
MLSAAVTGVGLAACAVYVQDKMNTKKMYTIDGYTIRSPNDIESVRRLKKLSAITLQLFDVIRASNVHKKHKGCMTLLKRFKCPNSKCDIKEREYKHGNQAAYTVNKKHIGMCMTHNGKHEDINTMVYVYIHELAHVMSTSLDHGTEFWDNFEYILSIADKAGLYKYQPFHENNGSYCGHSIKYTPYIKY